MNKFTSLFEAAYNLRKFVIERDALEAYRLYDRESDKLTEVSIDVYRDWAEIQIYAPIPDKKLFLVVETLTTDFKIKGIYVKDRVSTKLNNRTALTSGQELKSGFLYGERHPKEFVFEELDYKYSVNLEKYLDTGVFLDARNVRKWIKKRSKGKRVLNLFSYTSMSSLSAISGGAKQTVSVDISKTYTDWAKENFEINDYSTDENLFVTKDVLEFLKSEKGRSNKYELIILDPPTFSHSKNGDFSVQRDHVHLLNECLYCLTEDGKILFTTHYKDFHFLKNKIKAKINEITEKTVPIDFRKDIHRSFIIRPSQKWEKIESRKMYSAQKREWKKEDYRRKKKKTRR